MRTSLDRFFAWYHTDSGRKKVRYFLASVIATVVSQAVLFFTYTVGEIASAVTCNFIATAAGAVPSYYLNRAWAWGKTGRSRVAKEIVPFWILAFVGLVVSLGAVAVAEHQAKQAGLSHLAVGIVVNLANLAAFGVVWVLKYIIFDKFVFVPHHGDLLPATGSVPTSPLSGTSRSAGGYAEPEIG